MQQVHDELIKLHNSVDRSWRTFVDIERLERKLEDKNRMALFKMEFYKDYLNFLKKEVAKEASYLSRGIKEKENRIKEIKEKEKELNEKMREFIEENYEVHDSYESNFGTHTLINSIGRSIKTYEIFLVDVKNPYNQIRRTRTLISRIVGEEAERLHGVKFNERIEVRYKTEITKNIRPMEVSFETVYKDRLSC